MPQSAIGCGVVHAVLAPEDMPDLLQRYARHLRTAPVPDVAGDRMTFGRA